MNEQEREWLENFLKPYGRNVVELRITRNVNISFDHKTKCDYLTIYFDDPRMNTGLPRRATIALIGMKFEGLDDRRNYKLEDLGL